MIRPTRAVRKRITIEYAEMSDSDSVVMTDMKISKKKKIALFLKNLDHQVEATKKKAKHEQSAYVNSITSMYNTLIGKIPKPLQALPVNQFIANDGKIEERPEAENVRILSRPSEIVDLHLSAKKRLVKGKTPAKPEMPPPNDDDVLPSDLLKSKEKTISKLKLKKEILSGSTKQAPCFQHNSTLATPMESVRPKRMLRSTAKTAALSTTKSTGSKKLSAQKSNTPFLSGTAPVAKKSTLVKNYFMAPASAQQRPTAGRKRSSTQSVVSAKSRKIAASPLRQHNQPTFANASQSSFGSQHLQQHRSERRSPDENAAPSIDSITLLISAHSNHPCRPGEKVLRLQDATCPLTESQPAIICPLEDGNALTISCDTDFESLTLPEAIMDNLRSFQKKLCAFLRIPAFSED